MSIQQTKNIENILWHYTVGRSLKSILADGVIHPATEFVPRNECSAVWFSKNTEWEQTANKGLALNDGEVVRFLKLDRQQMHDVFGGLARIGVEPATAPHDWDAYVRLSGIQTRAANRLHTSAVRLGSRPEDWFVSFSPVPRSLWVATETWDGKFWN